LVWPPPARACDRGGRLSRDVSLERLTKGLRTRGQPSPRGLKGRRNPARGGTPGLGRRASCSCTLKGCRRGLLRPFRPRGWGLADGPRIAPGARLPRPFRPPEIDQFLCAALL